MAASEPTPVLQLRDLLLEKQEPFLLDVYLSDRGYLEDRTKFQRSFSCCRWNPGKLIKRSVRYGSYKSRKVTPWCLKVLKAACNQFISTHERPKTKETNHRAGRFVITPMSRNYQKEFNGSSSSASSTTMYDFSSKIDDENTITSLQQDLISFAANISQPPVLCNQIEKEVTSNRKLQSQCSEDGKQLSPVSVLEEINSCGSSPLEAVADNTEDLGTTTKAPKRVADNSIFCGSVWKLLFQSGIKTSIRAEITQIKELVSCSHYSQHGRISKTQLQQTKQLLFDCVREVVENQTRNVKAHQLHKQYLESEELGKLVVQRIKSWGKQFGDESNPIKLSDSNLVDPAQEWSTHEQQRSEIGMEIGDAILEEINTEIIMDMIDHPL